MTPPRKSRRLLWILLALLAVSLVGLRTFLWRVIVEFFDRERVNVAAVEELKAAPLPTASPAPAAVGWPQWRGPNRDGVAPAGPLNPDWKTSPPRPVWSAPCGGGYASLAVVAGRVYGQDYQNGQERVFALDAETGKPLWEYAEPADYSKTDKQFATGPRATPTVHEGRVYAVGAAGRFVCLEPPSAPGGPAKLLWAHDLLAEFDAKIPQWGIAGSPLIEGNLVVVQPGGRKGTVAAFDKVGGEVRWAAGKNPNGYSSPVAATAGGVRQIVAVTGDAVLGLRPTDGSVLWTYPWITRFEANVATPIVVGDYVFVSSYYGKGCALLHVAAAADGASASEVYFRRNRVMRNHQNTCVYRDGFLYGFDEQYLKCVNLRTGEVVAEWEADPRLDKGTLLLADKYLLGMTESGKLFLADADPKAFVLRGKTDPILDGGQCWATPVLVDGRLYVRGSSEVKCFDVR